jgi:hypothetical protein
LRIPAQCTERPFGVVLPEDFSPEPFGVINRLIPVGNRKSNVPVRWFACGHGSYPRNSVGKAGRGGDL